MVTVSLIQCNFEFCKHWLHSCSHDIKRSTSVIVVRRSFTRIAENSLSLSAQTFLSLLVHPRNEERISAFMGSSASLSEHGGFPHSRFNP